MKNWLFPLWVIIDVLVFVAAISSWIAAPEFKTLNISMTIFAFALAILLGATKFKELKKFVASKYFSKVLFHSVNVALVLSIFALINYLGNKNYKEFDLTSEKRNSLTDQTRKVLEAVDAPLKMTVFAKREEWAPMLNLLKLYEAAKKEISLEAIDTDLRPDLVKAKNVTQNGTVFINYKGKETSFILFDELTITNGLLRILRTEEIILYMVKGHEELSCKGETPEGISVLCNQLEAQNYELRDLDLTKVTEVPRDASGVLLLGPATGLLDQEVKILDTYLKKGGGLFISLAPAFKKNIYENIMKITRPFGLEIGEDVVIDRLSTIQGAEATIPIIDKYDAGHVITNGFTQRTVFPLSASVRIVGKKTDTALILAETTSFPGSWAESDLKGISLGNAKYDEGKDLKGPIGLLGISEGGGESTARLVVLGSSSFLINGYQNQSGNTTLFLNAVSWIVNDEGIISFNRPGLEEAPVILSAQHLQLIFVISILVVPIVFFGCAIFIYRRRRLL